MQKIKLNSGRELDCEAIAPSYDGSVYVILPHTGMQEAVSLFCDDSETAVMQLINSNGDVAQELRNYTILSYAVNELYGTRLCIRTPRMDEIIVENPNEEATND